MREKPKHIEWLVDTGERLTTADGKTVEVWELCHQPDDAILSAWAKHFREHYCLDTKIDKLRKGPGLSRSEYLLQIKFPKSTTKLGPGIRAGDFGEILVADYLEYVLGYWVPRVRYGNKSASDESEKGCDTIGFLIIKDGEESVNDCIVVYETKARLTSDHLSTDKEVSGFQAAINGSAIDYLRLAESLNYLFEILDAQGKDIEAGRVVRFQNSVKKPCKEISGAVTIYSNDSFNPAIIKQAKTNKHPNQRNFNLLIIRGEQLMRLTNQLYERAANEADKA